MSGKFEVIVFYNIVKYRQGDVLAFGEIGEVYMNKQEASEFLGVSVRALERYVHAAGTNQR
ncbi:hypothetical protein [Anabaena sp. CS-542/02]|uniref:hypothetical protein n=1 Tax=Anabaena sp. CS-542/02 TaxID=3021719 RepID=UPI0023305CE1|nr:hypothetical protein [Anabaena sp. CS-542/02]MDB9447780.1 hypothetical protein [Anabaena sp. CS-542/02]